MDNVLARIDGLLGVQRGRTKELAEYMGYTNANVISDWRAGRSKSYMKQLPKIAEFLGTTVTYLTGQTDDPAPEQKEKPTVTNDDGLSIQWADVEAAFKAATPEMREAAKAAALAVLSSQNK